MRGQLTPWTIRGMGLALGVALVYGLIQFGIAAGGVLLLLFVAILLASALTPAVGWIRNRTGLGRGATILLVYAAFFLVVIVIAFIVVPAALKQAEELLEALPPFFAEARAWTSGLQPPALARSVTALVDSVAGILRPPPPPDPDTVVEVGTAVAEGAVTLATLLTIVFFWLVEHAQLQRYALAFVPIEGRAGVRSAWNEIESRLGMWVHALGFVQRRVTGDLERFKEFIERRGAPTGAWRGSVVQDDVAG